MSARERLGKIYYISRMHGEDTEYLRTALYDALFDVLPYNANEMQVMLDDIREAVEAGEPVPAVVTGGLLRIEAPINGDELARVIKQAYPEALAIIASGSTPETSLSELEAQGIKYYRDGQFFHTQEIVADVQAHYGVTSSPAPGRGPAGKSKLKPLRFG